MSIHAGHIVKSVSIENLLAHRQSMVDRLRQVNATLLEINEIGKASGIFTTDDSQQRSSHRYGASLDRMIYGEGSRYAYRTELIEPETIDHAAKRLDAMAWDMLMHESGLWSLMDAKAREQWGEKIDKQEVPELTAENIRATFESLHDSRGEMFERGVLAAFKGLSWCYKTNLPQKFGKRIHKRVKYYGSIDSSALAPLEDLQRVFCVLDGKPEEDRRNGIYMRLSGASRADRGYLSRFEHDDEYMSFRVFGNGNAAITFKRPDLVEKMNRIIGKHYPGALPAPK